jgi:tRNA pseudouridine38-40 synthase
MSREGDWLLYRVRGSGFLKHMVRNIAGLLLEAGKGNVDQARLRDLLANRAPAKAGPTAPAKGLFLTGVEYEG